MNNYDKAKLMVNFGLAGEEIKPGLVKTMLFARNGVFEQKTGSWMGTYIKKVNDFVLNPSELVDELEDTYTMTDFGEDKLPFEAYKAAYHFYKYVCDLNGAEAQINFYINDKNLEEIVVDGETLVLKDIVGVDFWSERVFSYVPVQTNSAGLTSTTDPIYKELRRVTKPFIETHSHNTMSAFRSGTDEANSHIEGLQLVFGKLNNTITHDFKSWVTISGQQFVDVPYELLSNFIEMPEEIGNVEELGEFSIPGEWLTQCTFQLYSPVYKTPGKSFNGSRHSRRNSRAESWRNNSFYDFGFGYEAGHVDDHFGSYTDEQLTLEEEMFGFGYETEPITPADTSYPIDPFEVPFFEVEPDQTPQRIELSIEDKVKSYADEKERKVKVHSTVTKPITHKAPENKTSPAKFVPEKGDKVGSVIKLFKSIIGQ